LNVKNRDDITSRHPRFPPARARDRRERAGRSVASRRHAISRTGRSLASRRHAVPARGGLAARPRAPGVTGITGAARRSTCSYRARP
jgi:hypothetical protein